MLAEIFTPERDWADVLFLIAIILAVVAGWASWPQKSMASMLGWFAVAAIAFGLMLQ